MTVHLHWLYDQGGATELRGVTMGVALCGQSRIARRMLTSFVEDCDCPMCLERAEKRKRAKKRGPRPQLNRSAKWRE
jgi:hypothetical protein